MIYVPQINKIQKCIEDILKDLNGMGGSYYKIDDCFIGVQKYGILLSVGFTIELAACYLFKDEYSVVKRGLADDQEQLYKYFKDNIDNQENEFVILCQYPIEIYLPHEDIKEKIWDKIKDSYIGKHDLSKSDFRKNTIHFIVIKLKRQEKRTY